MLLIFKRRIAEGFLVAADVAGIALSGSGAAVVAILGKFMLAVVLGAIAVGFFLRLAGRRRTQVVASPPTPMWSRGVSAVVAVVEVGLLVTDAQQHEAASRRMLRTGQLQRYTSP